jgi:phosphate-selective porin OprO/OprP
MVRTWGLFLTLAGAAWLATAPACAQNAAPPSSADFEQRLQAVERQYREMLEREQAGRREAESRYRDLEAKYDTLRRQVETAPESLPPALAEPEPEPTHEAARKPESESETLNPSLFDVNSADFAPWLEARFDDGFLFQTPDEELQLRLHVLNQNDFKVFVPGDQRPARSGLYIPRVRLYFEGQFTRNYGYEVSLQRSVEGIWDLLDANLDIRPNRQFSLRFGRQLVPYSYAWYDHLEQYFLVPERAPFPLNFGLSRSSGLVAHGELFEDRVQYALGGFDGRVAGVADNNTTHDAVAYVNFRPFLDRDESPLQHLNLGASGFIGRQTEVETALPLRTSVQTSENDEAANAASSIFLEFEDNVSGFGPRSGGAVHMAWYYRGLTVESEVQLARLGFGRFTPGEPLARGSVPIGGGHVSVGYFLTGEEVTDRSTVVPLRPFRLMSGPPSPGAIEVYARFGRLHLGESVFSEELSNRDEWTRDLILTDTGFNWYLNRYVKIYFDWQHSIYGSPVLLNPAKNLRASDNDLFWLRCQFWF